jgi:g-D-glutamyl-meso-diaminopimelate peptidase
MTNPDGVTLALEGLDALDSKELRRQVKDIVRSLHSDDIDTYLKNNWKSNARGVDINRNFDLLWEQYVVVSSNGEPNPRYLVPSFKEYKGSAPETEPESRALVALTEGLLNPVTSICVHSQGDIIYWRCTPESELWTENRRLAELTRTITGYRIIDENQTDAQTEPSYSNWTVFARGIPTVTVENGTGGYPQTFDMADGFFERNRDLWAAVAHEYYAD